MTITARWAIRLFSLLILVGIWDLLPDLMGQRSRMMLAVNFVILGAAAAFAMLALVATFLRMPSAGARGFGERATKSELAALAAAARRHESEKDRAGDTRQERGGL